LPYIRMHASMSMGALSVALRDETNGARMSTIAFLELNCQPEPVRNCELYGWGYNGYGQVGDDTTTDTGVKGPQKVASFERTSFRDLSAGQFNNLVLADDGSVWGWGVNNLGQLGAGNKADHFTRPVRAVDPHNPMDGLTGVKDISAGDGWHAAVVLNEGYVLTWGDDCFGQLGRCTINAHSWVPVEVLDVTNACGIALSAKHSLVVLKDGTVWGWGANEHGQLGDCTTLLAPTRRKTFALDTVVQVEAAGWHSLALCEDGTLWSWGLNDAGQLGLGDYTDRHVPTKIEALSDIVQVASSRAHGLAVDKDGTVWAWGNNVYGQLGDGTTTSTNEKTAKVPVKVGGLPRIKGVAAGIPCTSVWEGFSLALDTDGRVWSWGYNGHGELGDGTLTSTPQKTEKVPGRVIGADRVGVISAGGWHSLMCAHEESMDG